MTAYAEVIGDPIAQSKSPAIHGFWLRELGLEGEYRATRVAPEGLADFFAARRADPDWRGCNVTAPLKSAVIPFLDRIDPAAERIGAINCIYPDGDTLSGLNTDIDGIAEALAGADLSVSVLIGAGGAARAAVAYLANAGQLRILARDPGRAAPLLIAAGSNGTAFPIERAAEAMGGATAIINASTLGMVGADPMPDRLFDALAGAVPGATLLDMVTAPARTLFLEVAETQGLRAVDGLAMLIGQARRAFETFFGAAPPRERDADLRHLLSGI